MQALGGRGSRVATGYKLELKGRVAVTSKSQGLVINADQVAADVVESGTRGRSEIRNAVATGSVKMTKSVRNAQGLQTTEISGARIDLAATSQANNLKLAGPVTLRNLDQGKKQTLLATGRSATAVLDPGDSTQRGNSLRSAKLEGPVRVTIREFSPDGRESRMIATGNQMDISNQGAEQTIILSGNVKITGEGNTSIGEFTNLRRAVLRLNSQGDVTSFETEAG